MNAVQANMITATITTTTKIIMTTGAPSDSAHMLPPMASDSRWLMTRPSPEPPYVRVGEASTYSV